MENMLEFLQKIGKLKKLKRTGWVLKDVPEPESVAEHTFRVAVMALVLSEKEGLNRDKCVKMALVHDLAEAIVGDITPYDKISEGEKYKMEKKAMQELTERLGDDEIMTLWEECEKMKTPEARFVYELDKTEMLIQAYEYEKEHGINLQNFWDISLKNVKNRELKSLLGILKEKNSD